MAGWCSGALAFDVIFSLAYFLRLGTAGLTAQAVGARDPRDGLMHVAAPSSWRCVAGVLMIALPQPLLWLLANLVMSPAAGVDEALATYFRRARLGGAVLADQLRAASAGSMAGRNARTGMSLQILIHGVNIVLNLLSCSGWVGRRRHGVCDGVCRRLRPPRPRAAGPAFRRVSAAIGADLPAELLDGARRFGGCSGSAAISPSARSALMASYAYFAGRVAAGEVPLSGNAILINFLMIMAFFLDGLAQAAEQLSGKAVGATGGRPSIGPDGLSTGWGMLIGLAVDRDSLSSAAVAIDLMTTSEPVREHARAFLWLAALTGLTGMPGLRDGRRGVRRDAEHRDAQRHAAGAGAVSRQRAGAAAGPRAIPACGLRSTGFFMAAAESCGGAWSARRRGLFTAATGNGWFTSEDSQPHVVVITIMVVIRLVLALRLRRLGAEPAAEARAALGAAGGLRGDRRVSSLSSGRPRVADWLWRARRAAHRGGIGWYRGKTVTITVDPQHTCLEQNASPAGIIFLVALSPSASR